MIGLIVLVALGVALAPAARCLLRLLGALILLGVLATLLGSP